VKTKHRVIPVTIGIMDFKFMGVSMGSVLGEKIIRLVEYSTNKLFPLIFLCLSRGARMQEGSLSFMQMVKISSTLYYYHRYLHILLPVWWQLVLACWGISLLLNQTLHKGFVII